MNNIKQTFVSGIKRERVASCRSSLYLTIFKFSEHKI